MQNWLFSERRISTFEYRISIFSTKFAFSEHGILEGLVRVGVGEVPNFGLMIRENFGSGYNS